MQTEHCVGSTIQCVAMNRGIQAVGARRMHSQLMCAPGDGVELNPCHTAATPQHPTKRDRLLAVGIIYLLPRTVVPVGRQRQADAALVGATLPSRSAVYVFFTSFASN